MRANVHTNLHAKATFNSTYGKCVCPLVSALYSNWMGLALCRWLTESHSVKESSSPSSSSLFLQMAIPPSSRLAVLLNAPPLAPGDPQSLWSPSNKSPNLHVSGSEVRRACVEQSSDAARAAVGVKTGLHVWEVLWEPGQRGSHALIGISTQHCAKQVSGYTALVGGDSHSWGWELSSNQLWHEGAQKRRFPVGNDNRQPPMKVPRRVLVVVDVDAGTLGYVVDGSFLGMAFTDLPQGMELFPAVSCVWGGACIQLRYLNGMTRDPPTLFNLCHLIVREELCKKRDLKGEEMPAALLRMLATSQ